MHVYVDKLRQMDKTEVNGRAESLRRLRRELYRMQIEEKHQKKQKQVRYIYVALFLDYTTCAYQTFIIISCTYSSQCHLRFIIRLAP